MESPIGLLTIDDRATGVAWIRLPGGKGFSFHEKIARNPHILIYFVKPCRSWGREANKNTNGLFGQYFPKGAYFGAITDEQVMRVQNVLNSRPEKRSGHMTSKEKFKLLMNNEFEAIA